MSIRAWFQNKVPLHVPKNGPHISLETKPQNETEKSPVGTIGCNFVSLGMLQFEVPNVGALLQPLNAAFGWHATIK
jgi:hypothetical protein